MRFAIFMLFVCAAAVAQPPSTKLAPPVPTDAVKARQAISDAFGPEIEKAKTPTARKALAAKMLAVANDVKETSANRWVLYVQSRDLALNAGDITLAIQSIEEQVKTFAIGRHELTAENLDKLAKAAGKGAPKPLLDFLLGVAEESIQADNYPTATKLLTVGSTIARQGKDAALAKRFELRQRMAGELAKNFDEVTGVDEHMGKFQCFRKNNWVKGLPLLMNSQDTAFAAVVKKDLAAPTEAKDRVELGDAWFALAEKAKGAERLGMLRRAYWWYRQSFGGTEGLAKAKIEGRMGKIFDEVEKEDAKEDRFTLWEGYWALKYNVPFVHEYRITADGNFTWCRRITPEGEIGTYNIRHTIVRVRGAIAIFEGNSLTERFICEKGGEIKSERFHPPYKSEKPNLNGHSTNWAQ